MQRHHGGVGQLQHQLVAGDRALEDPRVRRAEADRDRAAGGGHRLAGPQQERHAAPAVVVDPGLERHEGLNVGVRVDVVLLAVALELAEDAALGIQRTHRLEDRGLGVAQRTGLEGAGILQRHEAEDLGEVGGDHVAQRAGGLVERAAPLQPELLGYVDLDRLHRARVPRRLEEAVGEAEREDVLHRLLAQEVVDAEDLVLLDDVLECGVQVARGRQVQAERLLHDQTGPVREPLLAEHRDHRLHRARGDGEVEQPPDLGGVGRHRLLGLADGLGQVGAVLGVGGLEAQPREQVVGEVAVEVVDAVVEGRADPLAELLVGAGGVPPGADDGVLLGQPTSGREVVEPGEQLAGGQVAGRAEEDQDVRGQGRAGGVAHDLEAARRRPCGHHPPGEGAVGSPRGRPSPVRPRKRAGDPVRGSDLAYCGA